MEADWSVELGPKLPEIHVPWEGFIDLRQNPARLDAIPEAARYPALARALAMLNGELSPVFTAKSDGWSMTDAEIDPYEFAAQPQEARCGMASYIDLVERSRANAASFGFHEKHARRLVAELRELAVPNGRVELVVRGAHIDGLEGYGITLYAAGCGGDPGKAAASWEAVLAAAVLATMKRVGSPSQPAAHPGE